MARGVDDAADVDGATENGGMAKADTESVESEVKALVQSWGLSRFSECMARQWLVRLLSTSGDPDESESSKGKHDNAPDPLARLRKWIAMQLSQQRIREGRSHWQYGCPEMIPLLRAQPVWDRSEFPWVRALESAFPVIKQELLALTNNHSCQAHRSPPWASNISAKDRFESVALDAGDWSAFYLFLPKMDFKRNRSLCPKTVAAIEAIGGDHYDRAFFSPLAAETRVKKQHGPANKTLRCYLPLVVPEGEWRLCVGEQLVKVQEGKCILVDHSFEYEAWNEDAARNSLVLVVDVWHPDLSGQERRFLRFLRNSRLPMDDRQRERARATAAEAVSSSLSKEATWS